MNAIRILSSEPWVERLGWTLVHFLWQGILISALYAAARQWAARSSGPNVRYRVACAALAAMIAAPLVTFILGHSSEPYPAAAHLSGAISSTASAARSAVTVAAPAALRESVPGPWIARSLPWVVAIWLVGAIAFWTRLMGGWMVAARMQSRLVRPAPPEWQKALERLKTRVRVSGPVRLLTSALVEVPMVVGWLRPVVLVPVGALAGLPPEQVEALLLHELAHIRRHDYLVNIVQSIAEALLFYHPAVWWVSGHIRAERELCCDDIAVSATGGDALAYASALAELESCRPAHIEAAVAANGGSLADRIARLLGETRPMSLTLSGPGVIASAFVLLLTACAVFGQPETAPKFDVASVKLNAGDRRGMRLQVHPGGGLTTENTTLQLLMQNAYTLQAFQIVGGPGWYQSDGYNIEAKGEVTGEAKRDAKSNQAQVYLMLRSLLEDRFQLKTHRETREGPVYALTVSRNGPKLPQPKEGSCVAGDSAPPPPARGQLPLPPCGAPRVSMGLSPGAQVRIQGGKVSMADLTKTLAMIIGRPVVDKTAYTDKFDLVMEFTPDEAVAGLPRGFGGGDPSGPSSAPDPGAAPTIFAAIQEQLGLRLESAKGPVEVLVIDRVERPSGN